ncbi:Rz-like spanin [Vibrio phage VPMS1]|uniref:Rz-like spanin n=1 Tax=Vibrio phage VPMS1 TaxID=1233488 RepID=UPI0003586CFC|nr:Rz-like spanin [Vibrio phage VPMS1]AFV51089.1 Rz lysis protein [Vibrio phage VPMS1]
MANTNVTRWGETAQKKIKRVMALKVTKELFTDNGLSVATANLLIAELPANAVLTDAYAVVSTVSDAATTATVQLGTAEAGAQIMTATDIKSATGVVGDLVGKLATGTGMKVYARVVLTGAVTTPGEVDVVIEYTEYETNSGEYTKFV